MGAVEIVVAVLGIVGSVVTWLISRWWGKEKKKAEHKKAVEAEEKHDRKKTAELRKKLTARNNSIRKQREAAKEWDPK